MTAGPATAADAGRLAWLDDGTRDGVRAALAAPPGRALVIAADDAGVPVGVLVADLLPWRKRQMPWIWLVDVHPGARGRGHGTALLEAAHARLAAAGFPVVELSVDDDNRRARRLYERLGYAPAGSSVDPDPAGDRPWTRLRRTTSPG